MLGVEGDWEGMDGGIRRWICLRYIVNTYEFLTNMSLTPSLKTEVWFFFLIMPILSNTLSIHLKMIGKSFEMCGNKSKVFKWRNTIQNTQNRIRTLEL